LTFSHKKIVQNFSDVNKGETQATSVSSNKEIRHAYLAMWLRIKQIICIMLIRVLSTTEYTRKFTKMNIIWSFVWWCFHTLSLIYCQTKIFWILLELCVVLKHFN